VASKPDTTRTIAHPLPPASERRSRSCLIRRGIAVFNLAGNKYRIVVWINYPYRVVYIRFIGTHRQYDLIDAQKI
jgi:mRNA interferase HigB